MFEEVENQFTTIKQKLEQLHNSPLVSIYIQELEYIKDTIDRDNYQRQFCGKLIRNSQKP